MKTIMLILTLIIFISSQQQIHLYTHSWCPPCKKINKLFQKFDTKYPQINFIRYNYKNKTIIYKKDNNENNKKQQLSFPTIIFKCNSFNFTYQNDLTYNQLSYWIQAICLKKVQTCTQKINNQLYHILAPSQYSEEQFYKLAQIIIKNPHIKICIDNKSNLTINIIDQLTKNLTKHPLYIDYFSHNIRNYLIQSKRLGIALITNKKNTSFVQSFLNIYFSFQYHYMNQSQKKQAKRLLKYQLKKQQVQQLIFFQLCLNNNISECMMDGNDRYNQVSASQKITQVLLKYLDVKIQNLDRFQYIVAFRFNYPKLEVYSYHNFGVLDQKFLFWINQILSSRYNQPQRNEIFCINNMIIHRTSSYNLEDIETHQKLKHLITSYNNKNPQNKFNLHKEQKLYHFKPKFTLCLKDKKELQFYNNDQIEQLQKIIGKEFIDIGKEDL